MSGQHADLTRRIIGAAIEVHRELGPGLLESAYEECLCHELLLNGLEFGRQVPQPVIYKGARLDCGYRLDIVVAGLVVIDEGGPRDRPDSRGPAPHLPAPLPH